MSAFARAVTPLRDARPATRQPCVGCQQPVATRDTWAVCTRCTERAWAWIRPRAPKEGAARRMAFNAFWGNEQAVSASLAELRQGAGAS